MAEEIALKITTDGSQAEKSVKSIRQELREAQQNAVSLARQFGELSPQALEAAQKVANLRDEFGDLNARIQALNPDAKFKAFSQSLQGVAGGFAGLQGAIGLFGTESAELEKQLLKVQSALALSQGIDSVLEARDSFKTLGAIIRTNVVSAFSTLRGAIIATGIGALAIGLGLVIANFDKVKKVVLNLVPGLAKVGEFIGGIVDKITDFVGVTSEATRAYDRLAASTKRGNEDLDNRIKLLQAQGGQEAEVARLTKQRAENELNVLRSKLKAEGKLNEEELKQFRDLKFQKQLVDAQETKRLNDEAQKRAEEQKKRYEQQLKEEQDRRNGEVERLKGIEAVNAQIKNDGEKSLQASLGLLRGDKEIADRNAELNKTQFELKQAEERVRIQKEEVEAKAQVQEAYLGVLSQFGGLVSALAGKNKALAISGIVIEQAAAIGRIISNTAVANAKAVAASPLTGGMPFVAINKISAGLGIASSIASAAKAIQQIKSAPGGSASGGVGGLGAGAGIPSGMGATQAPIQAGIPVTNTQAIGTTDVNLQNQSAVKAFVVEKDITDSQDRISKIKAAATI